MIGSSFDILYARLLTHPGNNPRGKFYFAALVHDKDEDWYMSLTNWGQGDGQSATPYLYGDSGQAKAEGPFTTESAARSAMNKKLTEKLGENYRGDVVDCRFLGAPAQTKLIEARGGATPVSMPTAPTQQVNTATLLGLPLTPDTIGKIAEHRAALDARLTSLRYEIAGIEAEAEALTLRMSFHSA